MDSQPKITFNYRTGGLLVEYSGMVKDRKTILCLQNFDQIPMQNQKTDKDNLQKKKEAILFKEL